MNDKNVATVRTGWNVGLFTAAAALLYKLTGWVVTVDDLLPFAPVIAIVGGVFYRLSRVISEKVKWLGYILFGNTSTPTNYEKPE
jgi:hypothetical protein